MTTPKQKRSPGRPDGAKNIKYDHADVELSRCKRCDSTAKRSVKGATEVLEYSGIRNGKPYTSIVRVRVICEGCGQFRKDTSYHYEPKS